MVPGDLDLPLRWTRPDMKDVDEPQWRAIGNIQQCTMTVLGNGAGHQRYFMVSPAEKTNAKTWGPGKISRGK